MTDQPDYKALFFGAVARHDELLERTTALEARLTEVDARLLESISLLCEVQQEAPRYGMPLDRINGFLVDGYVRPINRARASQPKSILWPNLIKVMSQEALRYRWLRDSDVETVDKVLLGLLPGEWDAAIDVARVATTVARDSTPLGTEECRPYDLPPGEHDWHHGQCGRCGDTSTAKNGNQK